MFCAVFFFFFIWPRLYGTEKDRDFCAPALCLNKDFINQGSATLGPHIHYVWPAVVYQNLCASVLKMFQNK